jgi:hypothetical protein
MKNLNKLFWALVGAEVTCVIGAIYSYGQVRYYKGKTDAYKHMQKEVEKLHKEFGEKYGIKFDEGEAE